MADVIRDVVVRITLEQINTALKVPDYTPLKTGQAEVGKSIEGVGKKYDIQAEDAKRSAKLQRELTKDIVDAGKQGAKDYETLLKKRADAEKQVAAAAELAAAKQSQAQLKVLDTTKQLGEGVFQLARGIAFLATSGDEDFREMLATIAKLQGGFDLIKGGATTIKAMVEGVNALKIATGAATVGQALLAGANTVVATTAGAATAAVTALKVALGPIGLIITGIGVAAAAASAILSAMFSESAESEETLADAMARANRTLEARFEYEKRINEVAKNTFDKKLDLLSAEDKLAAITKNAGERELQRLQNIEKLQKQKELTNLMLMEKAGRTQENVKVDGLFFKDEGLTQEQKEINVSNSREKEVELAKLIAEQSGQDYDYQQQKHDLLTQISELKSSELEKEKQIAAAAQKGTDAARDKLAVEEKKLRSLEAQFGALTKQEQLELKALSDKVKAGEELSRRELERASQLGGEATRDFVEQQRSKEGKAAGFSDVAAGFGFDANAGVVQAGRGLQDAISKQAEAEARAAEAQVQLERASATLEENTRRTGALIDLVETHGKQLADIFRTFDQNNGLNQ